MEPKLYRRNAIRWDALQFRSVYTCGSPSGQGNAILQHHRRMSSQSVRLLPCTAKARTCPDVVVVVPPPAAVLSGAAAARRRRRRRRRTAIKPSAAVRACAAAPPSPAHTVWASGGSSAKVHALFPAVHGEPGLRMRAVGPTTAASSSAQRSRPLHSAATELSIAGGASAAAVHRRGVCARPCSPPDASQPVRAVPLGPPLDDQEERRQKNQGAATDVVNERSFLPLPLRAASGACDYAFESQVPEVARGRLRGWSSE